MDPNEIDFSCHHKRLLSPNIFAPRLAKTLEKLKRTFYWPKMTAQVMKFVKSCEVC